MRKILTAAITAGLAGLFCLHGLSTGPPALTASTGPEINHSAFTDFQHFFRIHLIESERNVSGLLIIGLALLVIRRFGHVRLPGDTRAKVVLLGSFGLFGFLVFTRG